MASVEFEKLQVLINRHVMEGEALTEHDVAFIAKGLGVDQEEALRKLQKARAYHLKIKNDKKSRARPSSNHKPQKG